MLEALVVLVMVVLAALLIALTATTQLLQRTVSPSGYVRWRWPGTRLFAHAWSSAVASEQGSGAGQLRGSGSPVGARRKRGRGKQLRPLHRRTGLSAERAGDGEEKWAVPHERLDPTYLLYEQHLVRDREKNRRTVQHQLKKAINSPPPPPPPPPPLPSTTTPSAVVSAPCTRCGIVNAKRNCRYSSCATCCRGDRRSVCKVHGTGYQAALDEVETASQYQLLEFDSSYSNLKKCPPSVTTIGKQLIMLNLSNNRLTSLPEDLDELCNLQQLFLQYNCLTKLPDCVCNLPHLFELDVKNNNLTAIPERVGDLNRLQVLSLTNNQIARLPRSVGKLKRLEELSVHSNCLTELPEGICRLRALKVMYCGQNKLTSLPSKFGQLVKLEELDFSSCELVSLPESFCRCVSLMKLWLCNNRLKTLPTFIGSLRNLKELHMKNNRLRYFPPSIQLLKLYTFTAQKNCFISAEAAQSMCVRPEARIPPLLDLAARAAHALGSHQERGVIPNHLHKMLQSPARCCRCGQTLFMFFSSRVQFKTIGVYYRVPLYEITCHPHCPQNNNRNMDNN